MAHFLRKINNYLKVKLFDKMDKKAWKFDERDYDNCLLYEKSDKALIRKFYPDDDPEDKHLLEQFIAYIYKFEMKMVVEPLYGWVIPGKLKVFKRSFPYVFDIWDNKKRMPSIIHFLLPKKVGITGRIITIFLLIHSHRFTSQKTKYLRMYPYWCLTISGI